MITKVELIFVRTGKMHINKNERSGKLPTIRS